jgi:hypothetical protein
MLLVEQGCVSKAFCIHAKGALLQQPLQNTPQMCRWLADMHTGPDIPSKDSMGI